MKTILTGLPFDVGLRQQLEVRADEHAIVYMGNVHLANRQEIATPSLVIVLLN